MKKRLLSLILASVLLFNTLSMTACVLNQNGNSNNSSTSNGTQNDSGNGNDSSSGSKDEHLVSPDVLAMLDGKYSDFEIPREKLEGALADALAKIDYALPTFTTKFPNEVSKNNVYAAIDNNDGRSTWTTGFWTGILWHAYELTGDYKYKNVANGQVPSFYDRIWYKRGVNHHDMGFLYTPSCVAAYKLDGNVLGASAAIMAADHLITRYHESAGFIQAWGNVGADDNYRLIVDCLLI